MQLAENSPNPLPTLSFILLTSYKLGDRGTAINGTRCCVRNNSPANRSGIIPPFLPWETTHRTPVSLCRGTRQQNWLKFAMSDLELGLFSLQTPASYWDQLVLHHTHLVVPMEWYLDSVGNRWRVLEDQKQFHLHFSGRGLEFFDR